MEPVIPFMYQAGIGYYAKSISRGCILEWDSELCFTREAMALLDCGDLSPLWSVAKPLSLGIAQGKRLRRERKR
jgi:hypothetical protein